MSLALDPDVTDFLGTNSRAFLVSTQRDGAPTVHPLGMMARDGGLWFNTYGASSKVRNLQRDPRAAVVVATSDDADEFRALVLDADVEPLAPGEGPVDAMSGAGDGGGVMSEEDRRRAAERSASGKRIYLAVRPRSARWCEPLAAPLVGTVPPGAPAALDDAIAAAKRPSRISMTAAEVTEFLARKSVAVLAAVGADHPDAATVRFAHDGATMVCDLPAASPVLAHLLADDRVCVAVEEFPTYNEIKGVIAHGRAHRVDDAGVDPGVVRVAVTIDRVASFDFTKAAR